MKMGKRGHGSESRPLRSATAAVAATDTAAADTAAATAATGDDFQLPGCNYPIIQHAWSRALPIRVPFLV